MFKNIFKSKRGSSTIYELLISLTLITFVMMFPIGVFSYMRTETNINDLANLAMQSIEKSGQLTPELIETLNDNLEEKNLPKLGEGSILITNLEVTTLSPNITVLTNQSANSIGINTTYDKFVTVIPEEGIGSYVKKYRNAYITTSGITSKPYTVNYDVKCNNMSCTHYGSIQYITNKMTYRCPSCNNISKLETCNEANVVYITIGVPVTDQVNFLNRIMRLISFGNSQAEIFEDSYSVVEHDGQYYFTKTLYGTAERYFYVGSGVQ